LIALSEKDKNEDSNEESNRTETNLHTNLLKKIKKESLSLAYLLVILIFLFKIICQDSACFGIGMKESASLKDWLLEQS